MTRLIINGDDLGMNESCSRAIAQAMREGLITDTTMMANGAFFDGALALARENGFLDRIGVHFNLTEGQPLTEAILTVPGFAEHGRLCKRYLQQPRPLSAKEAEAVRAELCAQAERLTRAGVAVTHADSHHYAHTYPSLAPLFAAVCRAYGIDKIRLHYNLRKPEQEGRVPNRYWREQGFITTGFFGRLSEAAEITVPDSTEIIVHPDYDREGVLIDRTAVTDGFPVGAALADALRAISGCTRITYAQLK